MPCLKKLPRPVGKLADVVLDRAVCELVCHLVDCIVNFVELISSVLHAARQHCKILACAISSLRELAGILCDVIAKFVCFVQSVLSAGNKVVHRVLS